MARIDFVPFPPTSFPYRDLLVLEQVPLERHHRVCEIGVGSGETTARLAGMCAEVTGFEISGPTVDALRYLERRHENLHLVVADVTHEEALGPYAETFDRAFSCDTLEHVAEPGGFFRSIATLLNPGGEFAVTFPNEPEQTMHGITRFDSPIELYELAADAGLDGVRIGAARLTEHAARVAEALGWKPLSLARQTLAAGRALVERARSGRGPAVEATVHAPQTFEETRFFKNMKLIRPLSPAVNLYWYGVLRLMAARGPSFEIDWDFQREPFSDCQIFMVGEKPGRTRARA